MFGSCLGIGVLRGMEKSNREEEENTQRRGGQLERRLERERSS